MKLGGKKLPAAVTATDIRPWPKRSGKVRDIYDLGDRLLIVATDRISAFDLVLKPGIPCKGRLLTGLSLFWFEFLSAATANHLITSDAVKAEPKLAPYAAELAGRSMLVRKAEVIPVECVVRGYLAGSGWKSYKATGEVCGIKLPKGLEESSKLPEPIFTPTTKAESGHDQNLSFAETAKLAGAKTAAELRDRSIAIYRRAADYALGKGIIIADTKFEFGLCGGKMILVDEVLTPDSSRFWPAAEWTPGKGQKSYDKQYVRDYLDGSGWNHEPPAPALPDEVVVKTVEKYVEAYERLSGAKFAV
jgi:phosphoribosylaminoimidazole-succinocarboxamide synthase